MSGLGLQSLGGCSQDDHSEEFSVGKTARAQHRLLFINGNSVPQPGTWTEIMVKKHNMESKKKPKIVL